MNQHHNAYMTAQKSAQTRQALQYLFAPLFGLIVLGFGGSFIAATGCAFFGIALVNVTLVPDRPVPLRWLIVLVASIQWVLAPTLAYLSGATQGRMGMYIDELDYMWFAVPALLAFSAGLLIFGSNRERNAQITAIKDSSEFLQRLPYVPTVLIGLSIIGTTASAVVPISLQFIAYLISNLKYAALFLVIFSNSRKKIVWISGVMLLSIIESLVSSLFHDTILWATIIALAYAFLKKYRLTYRCVSLVAVLLVLALIQSVKGDYRDEVFNEQRDSGAITFLRLAEERATGVLSGDAPVEDVYRNFVLRLNQGWIISAIMRNMEATGAYANGETITQGVVAAAVPRFLLPDKATAGGRETFRRLTGLEIRDDTSMGASVLGEAYGNFGRNGAIAFMLAFGLGVSGFIWLLLNIFRSHPLILGFFPAIFLHSIKAETDFVTVLNFMVKGGIVYGLVFLVLTRSLRSRNRRRPETFPARTAR